MAIATRNIQFLQKIPKHPNKTDGSSKIEVKNAHEIYKSPNGKLVNKLLTKLLKVLDLLRRASERKTVF